MALTLLSNNFEVNIHPVALFNIVHAYERRGEKSDSIVGTLLGRRKLIFFAFEYFNENFQVQELPIRSKLLTVSWYHIQLRARQVFLFQEQFVHMIRNGIYSFKLFLSH